MLKKATRLGTYAILTVVTIAVLTVAFTFLFGGAARVTAPFRGETSKIEKTEGDGAFRIATYEEFYDLCASVQSDEDSIKALKDELDGKPSESRKTQINTSLTALRSSRAESIRDYNSKAAQEHREAFHSADLPARLYTDSKETQCAA